MVASTSSPPLCAVAAAVVLLASAAPVQANSLGALLGEVFHANGNPGFDPSTCIDVVAAFVTDGHAGHTDNEHFRECESWFDAQKVTCIAVDAAIATVTCLLNSDAVECGCLAYYKLLAEAAIEDLGEPHHGPDDPHGHNNHFDETGHAPEDRTNGHTDEFHDHHDGIEDGHFHHGAAGHEEGGECSPACEAEFIVGCMAHHCSSEPKHGFDHCVDELDRHVGPLARTCGPGCRPTEFMGRAQTSCADMAGLTAAPPLDEEGGPAFTSSAAFAAALASILEGNFNGSGDSGELELAETLQSVEDWVAGWLAALSEDDGHYHHAAGASGSGSSGSGSNWSASGSWSGSGSNWSGSAFTFGIHGDADPNGHQDAQGIEANDETDGAAGSSTTALVAALIAALALVGFL